MTEIPQGAGGFFPNGGKMVSQDPVGVIKGKKCIKKCQFRQSQGGGEKKVVEDRESACLAQKTNVYGGTKKAMGNQDRKNRSPWARAMGRVGLLRG